MLEINKSISKLNISNRHHIYHKLLQNKNVKMTIAIGPAGTVKEEEIGILPGTKDDKMLPWMVPIYDVFKQYITTQRLKEYLSNEEIEVCPLSYIRGRSFHNSWIIADEVQNTTTKQMKALLTRIGHDTKISLTGDLDQCDIKGINGLEDFIQRFNLYIKYEEKDSYPIKLINFEESDIMRSDIVKEVIKIYK